ncbi:MAG: putative lipid II flippase FtsW [Pseudomonadota bacterium]
MHMGVVWAAMLLLGIGIVMVYSASIVTASAAKMTGLNPAYFLTRHVLFVFIGLMAALLCGQVSMKVWQKSAMTLFLIGTVLLIVVLIPGLGREVNGSRRWIPLLVVNLQPSEFMKLFAALYAADYTVRKAAYLHQFRRGFFPMFLVMVVVGWLLLKEPDFGALSVITSIAMGILFLGGLNGRLFIGLLGLLVVSFPLLVWLEPYRLKRLVGFWNPWADPFGKGYQLSHSLIAFGRGEWTGVGLGASIEKQFYLPEAHTDFLLAVIGEELGLAGVMVVICLFVYLVGCIFYVGYRAWRLKQHFSGLVAQGIGIWIGLQAFINMGVNMGLLPTKGLTLPFLSFGGSGLVVNIIAIAIVLRIDHENRRLTYGFKI